MRKINLLTLFIVFFGIFGCSSKDEDNAIVELKCSVDNIDLDYQQEARTISVECNQEWTAYSNDKWIHCVLKSGTGQSNSFDVNFDENNTYSGRNGSITVKSGSTRQTITVEQASKPQNDNIVVPDGYELVWNDEFDEGSVPSSDWSYETGAGGWGNNELQNYVSGSIGDDKLALIKDGILNIIAKKIDNTVYSIRMNTVKSWTYGYFEARLQLPIGKGTWPAFWMMPKNYKSWPDDGEIDIMEEVGYNPGVVSSSIHTKSYNHVNNTQKTASTTVKDAESAFHVYALEWTGTYIKGFVDGKLYFTFNNDGKDNKDTWPFNAPFYLKLNLAWGGSWGGAQGVDESALPATYQIDYVRVFQKK